MAFVLTTRTQEKSWEISLDLFSQRLTFIGESRLLFALTSAVIPALVLTLMLFSFCFFLSSWRNEKRGEKATIIQSKWKECIQSTDSNEETWLVWLSFPLLCVYTCLSLSVCFVSCPCWQPREKGESYYHNTYRSIENGRVSQGSWDVVKLKCCEWVYVEECLHVLL